MQGAVGANPCVRPCYRAGTGACPYNIYQKRGAYFLENSLQEELPHRTDAGSLILQGYHRISSTSSTSITQNARP